MVRFRALIAMALLLTGLSTVDARAPQAPAMNLSTLKRQIVAYHDSGQYMREIAAVDVQAEKWLDQQAKVPNAAIVLDIDETSVSNWDYFRRIDFGFEVESFDRFCATKAAPAIAPTRALYAHARRLHMAVFFVTGRRDNIREVTAADLHEAGYPDWTELMLTPVDYKEHSIVPFKSGARKRITEKGYHIVANVGDQYSDLAGGFSARTFKLPNPMYIVP